MLIINIKNARRIVLIFFLAALFLLFFGDLNTTRAQNPDGLAWGGYEDSIQTRTGLGSSDPRIMAANVVRVILGFLGVIAVLLILYAGWLWMSSGGNDDKISKAKKILSNAVIGLIIILASFALASFIINRFYAATTSAGNSGGGGSVRGIGGFGASGNNALRSHYPARNERNIARNTPIIITFREPINASDLISGGKINTENLNIFKTSDGAGGPYASNFSGSVSADNRTFTFTQTSPYIGSSIETIWYTVAIKDSITKANGDKVFTGISDGGVGYYWSFEVGNTIDLTPPKITSIIPLAGKEEPRNVIIQINFNEAIDPTSGSGPSSSFKNIEVSSGGKAISGNFYISNEYRTIEFLTEEACGVNSCGQTVYCLPGNSEITVLVKAATVLAAGEALADGPPYNGIVDMAGNSLDGNANNTAQGPQSQSGLEPFNANEPNAAAQGDDYTWTFKTNNKIDISAPIITTISPSGLSTNVGLDTDVIAVFNKNMMASSFVKNTPPGSGTVSLRANPTSNEVNFWLSVNNSMTGDSRVRIRHERFAANTAYAPEFNSGIKDVYQNCYSPSAGPGCVPNPPVQPYCCNGVLNAAPCVP
jgi:hypothetical protein